MMMSRKTWGLIAGLDFAVIDDFDVMSRRFLKRVRP